MAPPESWATMDYDEIPAMRWSMLRNMAQSPQHYLYALGTPRADTAAMRLGRAIHCGVLEPSKYDSRYASWRGERRGKEWLAFQEEKRLLNQEILSSDESARVDGARCAVLRAGSAYFCGGESEVARTWKLGKRACKGRLDYLSDRGVVELKTTRDASPSGFARESWRYLYHAQLAWYCDGVGTSKATIVAVESQPPYACVAYRVPEEVLDEGRATYQRLLAQLDRCLESGNWPGYAQDEQVLQIPAWAQREINDEDLEDIL